MEEKENVSSILPEVFTIRTRIGLCTKMILRCSMISLKKTINTSRYQHRMTLISTSFFSRYQEWRITKSGRKVPNILYFHDYFGVTSNSQSNSAISSKPTN